MKQEDLDDMARRFDPAREYLLSIPQLSPDSNIEQVVHVMIMLGRKCSMLTNEETIKYVIKPVAYELTTGEESPVIPPCYQK